MIIALLYVGGLLVYLLGRERAMNQAIQREIDAVNRYADLHYLS